MGGCARGLSFPARSICPISSDGATRTRASTGGAKSALRRSRRGRTRSARSAPGRKREKCPRDSGRGHEGLASRLLLLFRRLLLQVGTLVAFILKLRLL